MESEFMRFKDVSEEKNSTHGNTVDRPVRLKPLSGPSRLQKQIERQRDISRKACKDSNLKRKPLLTHDRLPIPGKSSSQNPDEQPLVAWDSDSDNEYEVDSEVTRQCSQQLLKDGFRLDEVSDDEDLDLIPPKPAEERCQCLCYTGACVIL
ncbi:protein FAM219A-like [Oscarella lobularis]|uniref:protein FAM219A-like n=1 Tax=Oscarella lobularis TaxID=121494 RepID=UPI003313AFC4